MLSSVSKIVRGPIASAALVSASTLTSSLGTPTVTAAATVTASTTTTRSFATRPPGDNPLTVIRKECEGRHLCDEHGYRRPGVHWVFSLAVTPDDTTQPPNLRTVGVQRVSDAGIDFVMKKGSGTCDSLATGRPLSFLHLQGRYMPGETAEQWRGEGFCERMPVLEPDILEKLPSYTVVSMVAAKRLERELSSASGDAGNGVLDNRTKVEDRSHLTEIMQKTRIEFENGDISMNEIDGAIRAFRFHPTRMECMAGGPDTIMWTRWEWQLDEDGFWKPPSALLSH